MIYAVLLQFQPCIITDCGELSSDISTWNINENDKTDDVFPPFPEDWDLQQSDIDVSISLLYYKPHSL